MRAMIPYLLAFFPLLALADVEFVSPSPGDDIQAGQIQIKWRESGNAPALASLTTYTLQLYVGGNTPDDSHSLSTLAQNVEFSNGNSFTANISPELVSNIENGFYIGITSPIPGGEITNFSGRFSLRGMTGPTPQDNIVQAASNLGKNTAAPKSVNTANKDVNGADDGAAGGDVGVGAFDIPYNLQTGLTRYAPMQPIPGTKITQQSFTPLFPTSPYTIAKTWLPQASIVTTTTAQQTFSVFSMENPAAPQSQPTDDMARFLARWKD